MDLCRCEACRPDDPDPRYTRAWMRECEARYVAEMPKRESRRAYLAGVERRRGKAAAERLREQVMAAWSQKAPARGADNTPAPAITN